MSNDPDRFYEGLCNVAYDAVKSATEALRERDAEIVRLRKTIAEFPSGMSDLQDRVTLLESLKTPPPCEHCE